MTRLGALLLALCLAAPPASGQSVEAEDGAAVSTGSGNAVVTGDNSTVTIIQGYTIEQHEAALARREAQIRADLAKVSSAEQELLRRQIADIESQRTDLQTSYDRAVRELTDLRNRLSDIGEGISQQKIDEAKQALYEGDRSKADALFAEVEAMEQESIDRAAAAAFERGKIAEQEVRWHDALKHFDKSARLTPTFENLRWHWDFLWKLGNGNEALRVAGLMKGAAIDESGRESSDYAVALSCEAVSLRMLGQYDRAEPLYRQAIEIGKATIGETHPDYATHLSNLAGLLRTMGRYDEAEPLYRQAIEIGKATIGEAHPDYATSLNNLAGLLRAMGRYDEAEPLYRQAIEIDKATIGETHPNYAIRLNNLALLLQNMGRYDEARPLYAEQLEIKLKAIGKEHPSTKLGAVNYVRLLRAHFPDDPALAELEATFGADIGR
ncbi:MAG: tetratricopeptide repeat protein [Pseudomonadota bacterium]